MRRTSFIGTVGPYPTRELAQAVANGLRMRVREGRNRESGRDILVEDLIHPQLCRHPARPSARPEPWPAGEELSRLPHHHLSRSWPDVTESSYMISLFHKVWVKKHHHQPPRRK